MWDTINIKQSIERTRVTRVNDWIKSQLCKKEETIKLSGSRHKKKNSAEVWDVRVEKLFQKVKQNDKDMENRTKEKLKESVWRSKSQMVGITERENTPNSLSQKASGVCTLPKWGSKLKKKEDMGSKTQIST